MSKDPVSGWESGLDSPLKIYSRRLGNTACVARGRGPGSAGWWNGSDVGGRSERREQPRERVQDSSSSNRRMPGRGRASQTRTQGGTRERGKVEIRNVSRFPIPASSFLLSSSLCTHQSGRVLIWAGGSSLSEAQGLNLLLPSVSLSEKRSPRGDVGRDGEGEETTGCGWRRREREGEEEVDICSGRRRTGKRKREWKGAQRLVNGRFKTGPPARNRRSAEHQAACSTGCVVRYFVPALAWCSTTDLQGKPGHLPAPTWASSAVRRRQEPTSAACARSWAP